MTSFFITGTGTEIGKTYVTAAMIRHWRGRGMAARGLKPVASGYQPAQSGTSDAAALLRAMGNRVVSDTEVEKICPWRFADPLSPDMAAARARRTIPFHEVMSFCIAEIETATAPLLIEGVGGVLVPLDSVHTVRDWMETLGIPVILVAGGYLGTISHTLCAVEALRMRRISIAAIVLNPIGELPVPIEETCATICRHLGAPPDGINGPDVLVVGTAAWLEWLDQAAAPRATNSGQMNRDRRGTGVP